MILGCVMVTVTSLSGFEVALLDPFETFFSAMGFSVYDSTTTPYAF